MSDFFDPQTAAEIKALYESNADTNALTDARATKVDAIDQVFTAAQQTKVNAIDQVYTSTEKTKLSGIESGATADQSGAEMKAALSGLLTATELSTATKLAIAKAWVRFDGTGTVAIAASHNVSSITDNGTGNYTVNFTANLGDANYTITGSAQRAGYPQVGLIGPRDGGTFTASACQIGTNDDGGAAIDSPKVSALFFGN